MGKETIAFHLHLYLDNYSVIKKEFIQAFLSKSEDNNNGNRAEEKNRFSQNVSI
jgi:hypothetical protein